MKVGFFLEMLDFYENEGFPIKNNFSQRQLGVRLRRWREIAESLSAVAKYKLLGRRFVVSDLYPVKSASAK